MWKYRRFMQTRLLGKTGLELPVLSFGASSLGQEFRKVKLDEALDSVRVALDCGLPCSGRAFAIARKREGHLRFVERSTELQ